MTDQISVKPKGEENITEAKLEEIAKQYGYQFLEGERAEYTQLLRASVDNLQRVSEMEDYQPEPDYELAPRKEIRFPLKENNPDNAWAYRFDLHHKTPYSDILKGKTLCVKDNVCVAGVPCLIGTDVFTDWIPKMDATVITRIIGASGTVIGKAVCENLSTGAASFSSATGLVHNPYARGYSAGGSSSGVGNLVGSGRADMGIGCDQGGSIRIPASFCGLYGFKATVGLVPYTGCASYEAMVDHVGPMTRSCMDNALLLEAIAGVDGLDDRQMAGTPYPKDVPKYSQVLFESKKNGVKGLKIGILKEGVCRKGVNVDVEAKFRSAVKVFEELGAIVEEVSVPMHSDAPAFFSVINRFGPTQGRAGRAVGRRQVMLTDFLEKMRGADKSKMSVTSKNNLFGGDYLWDRFPGLYAKSVNLTRKLTEAYNTALSKYDVLVMPTTIGAPDAFPLDTDGPVARMAKMGIGKIDNTCPFNLSGHPALAMPIGFVEVGEDGNKVKLPTSLQIVGKYFHESLILRIAYAWENSRDWKEF